MADRALPSSGCWNRIPLEDGNLKRRSAARGEPLGMDDVVAGGGSQALVEGPAGNLVELLEPRGWRARMHLYCAAATP